ncbi:hypothetical protein [Paucibacter sp. Y2R2-4]|uniref:hypothetical protein n=1 Tax=Paucibacter sp. Y2R2-4 TaxID=2893553 RepID=UPI0021E3EE8A|nr:hypothetical protein [Paucibacter sp. Y2R2-4]MCV2349298.1 hypothetical protein [Paucibacter sp. Y2R2-4]
MTDTKPMAKSAAVSPAPATRGRPVTGKALSGADRSRLRRAKLAEEGKRQISGVTLSPAAANALTQLKAQGLTIDQAVSRALEALARSI